MDWIYINAYVIEICTTAAKNYSRAVFSFFYILDHDYWFKSLHIVWKDYIPELPFHFYSIENKISMMNFTIWWKLGNNPLSCSFVNSSVHEYQQLWRDTNAFLAKNQSEKYIYPNFEIDSISDTIFTFVA